MSFSSKRTVLTWVLIALIPIAGISGWLITKYTTNPGEQYQINIDGSTTVYKIIKSSLQPFMDYHPGVIVTVSGTGTGTGITSLIDGQADIAMASRPVKSEENISSGGLLKSFPIAIDALSIVVHASASQLNITTDVARAIFNGTISSWSDPAVAVAGLSGQIQVVVREAGSGTRDAFNELVMGDEKQLEPGSQYAAGAISKNSNQLIKDAIATNPNYIGYIGLGYVDSTVDVVIINGVMPAIETVKDGTYDLQRDLYLVTLNNPQDLIKEFINWMLSPEGQKIVIDSGFVNVATTSDEVFT